MLRILFILLVFTSCMRRQIVQHFPVSNSNAPYTGSRFFELSKAYNWQQRDSLAIDWFGRGAVPSFFKKFVPVTVVGSDSNGKKATLKYWVSPDYFALGTNSDWVRVPLTPMAAQRIMDMVHCVFPTRKMVDQIYEAATVKLSPVPMFAFRDSSVTMYQHHLIIEGQRKSRKGLIAGIKKDVVITHKIPFGQKKNRVAIYGWHQKDGKPIQPLHIGHVDWYVDYSHGSRFVFSKMKLNGKWVEASSIFDNLNFQKLLCDEDTCGYFKYPLQ